MEALAYLAGIDPIRVWNYRHFLTELVKKLDEIQLDKKISRPKDMLKWMHTLSRTELVSVIHWMMKKEDRVTGRTMQAIAAVFPSEYILACVWYFLARVYDRFLPGLNGPAEPKNSTEKKEES